ncbi:MAG TPA: aldo/keto reductase [Steroidobacteraceae bacterium]|nr:aldo/keto reductase [Steroidobacteraceae bacterium]
MQYARLGDSGLVVSRLAFGSMTFGVVPTGPFASVSKVDQAGANNLVARAIDGGINFFNGADVYAGGEAEKILGKAIGAKRKEVVIATKVGNRMGPSLIETGLSRRHIHAACDGSLARLGTDYIDVYLVHKVDPITPIEETIEALEDLVRQGKVRYVGFSNWPAWMAAKAIGIQRARGWSQFRAAEMYYSLVGRDLEHEVAPLCADAGVGVMVWSPLAGGFLSGKYTRTKPKGESGDRLGGFDFLPYDRERGYQLVDLLQGIAAKRGVSAAQISLAWLLTRPTVSSLLIGASSIKQLDDNLGATNVKLEADDLAQLEAATQPTIPYPNWFTARVADGKVHEALGIALATPPIAR